MSLLIESQYFPCISVIKNLIIEKHVTIEQCESYQKKSFRNRCIILSSNGLQSLTVPIIGGREQREVISNVTIDYAQTWQKDHWKGIISAYRKAPFFEFYESDVNQIIHSGGEFLMDLNEKALRFVFKVLKINIEVGYTSQYLPEYNEVRDLRNAFRPNNFQENLQNWQPRYFQVFEERFGFQPNLSILDLLFNEGPNARNLLLNAV